ncbi:MAG: Hsp20/alpha crystallin family protein [Halanaeroarchaeum sp.]
MTRPVPIVRPARRVGNAVARIAGRVSSRFHEATPLRPDVLESHDEFLVIFDAPGATISDVDVWYEDGNVEVRVDRFRRYQEDYEIRYPGRGLTLEGRVPIPDDALVDLEGTGAELRSDGTLHIRIPKAEDGDLDDIDA